MSVEREARVITAKGVNRHRRTKRKTAVNAQGTIREAIAADVSTVLRTVVHRVLVRRAFGHRRVKWTDADRLVIDTGANAETGCGQVAIAIVVGKVHGRRWRQALELRHESPARLS